MRHIFTCVRLPGLFTHSSPLFLFYCRFACQSFETFPRNWKWKYGLTLLLNFTAKQLTLCPHARSCDMHSNASKSDNMNLFLNYVRGLPPCCCTTLQPVCLWFQKCVKQEISPWQLFPLKQQKSCTVSLCWSVQDFEQTDIASVCGCGISLHWMETHSLLLLVNMSTITFALFQFVFQIVLFQHYLQNKLQSTVTFLTDDMNLLVPTIYIPALFLSSSDKGRTFGASSKRSHTFPGRRGDGPSVSLCTSCWCQGGADHLVQRHNRRKGPDHHRTPDWWTNRSAYFAVFHSLGPLSVY